MKKKLSDLPVIDENLNKLFTKDSNKIIKELLNLFIKETPKLQAKINRAFQKKQQEELEANLHKLLGSCVYCGLLRLKCSLRALEKAIKNKNYSNTHLDQFNLEVKNALNKAKEIVESK